MLTRRWYKVREVAEYLNISPKSVYSLCERGLLPFTKMKGLGLRIDIQKLDEMLEREEITLVQEQLEK